MSKRIDIISIYGDLCKEHGIPFRIDTNVGAYDDTTLFCPAGMQQFKKNFTNQEIKEKTIANIQSCIRLNDYYEIGDGTHCICFDMIGLFSFRDKSLEFGIGYWMEFIKRIGLRVDYVTIHPDMMDDWKGYYDKYEVEVRSDPECVWSDGSSKEAYCTEFYIKDIEIGNIVNPGGDCLDVGFGYERLDYLVNGNQLTDRSQLMKKAITKILESGFLPGPKEQGSIVRKLYRDYIKYNPGYTGEEDNLFNKHFRLEVERKEKMLKKYNRYKKKHSDKDAGWWLGTHGIELDEVENL